MKLASTIVLASVAALAAAGAYADTRNSDKGKATMEQKASPSASKSDEERAEASQGQPDVPHSSTGSSAKSKSKPKKNPASKNDKPSSSAGSNAPAGEAADAVGAQRFKALDIDGDGAISKAEAAGNADLVKGFDRADRNHDGKLSRTEYDTLGKPKAKKQQASR